MYKINKDKGINMLLIAVELLAVLLLLYLVFLPFFPVMKYDLFLKKDSAQSQDLAVAKEEVRAIRAALPAAEYSTSPNRLIIKKIGVNAPIVESKSSEYGLSRGSWLVPDTSTPDKGGNTVLTGHRFKYLPPNNMTFYLFDKLAAGDMVSVIWHDRDYFYKIREVKIVDPTDVSVTAPTDKPTLTMYTCHPIYSTAQRLVVIADLIE